MRREQKEATSSSSGGSTFTKLPPVERTKIAMATEQRLYELACKARAKGMFCKIPPSHKRARAVADEMVKVVNYEKHTVVKPLADLTEAHKVIKDLNQVKTEKLNHKPGYNHIMSVLKEEFQNYSALAHQRGHDEKGEIFQLLAHYPKIGLILQRVNVDRPFRYDGVIDDLADCTHNTKKERVGSLLANKTRVRIVTPAVKKCDICEQKVVDEADKMLDEMHRKLEEDSGGFTVDATLQPHSFEKTFKMSRNLVMGTGSHDYAGAIDSLRKIWNLDISSVEMREEMFKNRIRQQKLTAMVNIYQDRATGEQLDQITKDIDTTANNIMEKDTITAAELQKLKESFGGSWEKVRKSLGTPSSLYSDERKIRRLQSKLEDAETANAKLRRLYEQEKAKNQSDDGKHISKHSKHHDKDDRDGRERKNKEKNKDKDNKDKDEPSTSSSHSSSSSSKRSRFQ